MTTPRTMRAARIILAVVFLAFLAAAPGTAADPEAGARSSLVVSLGGTWLLTPDPQNAGRQEKWWEKPVVGAKPARVPWIIQDAFPGYHGVAWFWRDFIAPANPHVEGRYLLRFWAVDYLAEVWLNGVAVGGHEGGEGPFVLDVTSAIRPGRPNLLAVRVLNPTNEPIVTTFRDLKPGTVDCVFDGWYPLRWCLFVEPVVRHISAGIQPDRPYFVLSVTAHADNQIAVHHGTGNHVRGQELGGPDIRDLTSNGPVQASRLSAYATTRQKANYREPPPKMEFVARLVPVELDLRHLGLDQRTQAR